MKLTQNVQVVSLDQIIEFWVKKYEFPNGEKLVRAEHYVDQVKGKVCFVLTMDEDAK